ncbi:hypothetical protein PAXRUDRAFT_175015, partial [Paxillus rubicundulus Ve08.2h10]
ISVKEQLGIFLYTCVTGLSSQHVTERFQHVPETITSSEYSEYKSLNNTYVYVTIFQILQMHAHLLCKYVKIWVLRAVQSCWSGVDVGFNLYVVPLF